MPFPFPLLGAVSVIQPTSVVAVHAQMLVAATVTVPDPPKPLLMTWAAGATSNVHAAGSGRTADGIGSGLTIDDVSPQPGTTAAAPTTRTVSTSVPCRRPRIRSDARLSGISTLILLGSRTRPRHPGQPTIGYTPRGATTGDQQQSEGRKDIDAQTNGQRSHRCRRSRSRQGVLYRRGPH